MSRYILFAHQCPYDIGFGIESYAGMYDSPEEAIEWLTNNETNMFHAEVLDTITLKQVRRVHRDAGSDKWMHFPREHWLTEYPTLLGNPEQEGGGDE